MILKWKCCGPVFVPPWGLVYDIKKDVFQALTKISGAAVGIGIRY